MNHNRIKFLKKIHRCLNSCEDKNQELSRDNLKKIFTKELGNNSARGLINCKKLFNDCDITEFRIAFLHILLIISWDIDQIIEFFEEKEYIIFQSKNPRYPVSKFHDLGFVISQYQLKLNQEDLANLQDPENRSGLSTEVVGRYLHKFSLTALILPIFLINLSEHLYEPTKITLNVHIFEHYFSKVQRQKFIVPVLVPPQYHGWEIVGEPREEDIYHFVFLIGNFKLKSVQIVDSNNSFLVCPKKLNKTCWIYQDILQIFKAALEEKSSEKWSYRYVQGPRCLKDKGECASTGLFTTECVLLGKKIPKYLAPDQRVKYRLKMFDFLKSYLN